MPGCKPDIRVRIDQRPPRGCLIRHRALSRECLPLPTYPAIEGAGERHRLARGCEPQAKEPRIEPKKSRLDLLYIEPVPHSAHRFGQIRAIAAHLDNVHRLPFAI